MLIAITFSVNNYRSINKQIIKKKELSSFRLLPIKKLFLKIISKQKSKTCIF